MREQKGHIFHRGTSWFVRYRDDVRQPDGTLKHVQVCEKLKVEYGGEYRTKASVKEFVEKILAPLNSGALNPASTQTVSEFVEKIYLPEYVEKQLRAASVKQYRDVWNNHLKPRMDKSKLTLRKFRTVHGEQMLAQIAEKDGLGRSSLRHCKAFLSGTFKQAYAYSLSEVKSMLAPLSEPAWTVMLCAALTGLRKSEIRGLTWENFNGKELSVTRSVWNSTVSEPKTRRSRSPIPVVKQLADALEAHKLRAGVLAQPSLPIFQAGNGQPLNLDNLARRVIVPALSPCAICRKQEHEHKPEGHNFQRDSSLPQWHGWHAFRRGLATNLHALGVDDKTIQAILRHSNIGITQNIYIKSVNESQVNAMDALSEKLEASGTALCNVRATSGDGPVN